MCSLNLNKYQLVIVTLGEQDGEYSNLQKKVNLSPGFLVNDSTLPYWTVPPINLPACNKNTLPIHVDVLFASA